MKYSFTLAAIIGLAAAADISVIPSCALPCIISAVGTGTPCQATDFNCVCENKNALISAATGCVVEKCGIDVATGKVLPATNTFCDQVMAEAAGGAAPSSSAMAPPASTEATSMTTMAPPASTEATSMTTMEASAASSASATEEMNSSYPSTTMKSSPTVVPVPTHSAPVVVPTAAAAAFGTFGGAAMLVLGAAVAAL